MRYIGLSVLRKIEECIVIKQTMQFKRYIELVTKFKQTSSSGFAYCSGLVWIFPVLADICHHTA